MRALLPPAAALALLVVAGCVASRPASLGAQCELNSECAAPLVCRLGYCRKECATSEDCSATTSCVLDAEKLGACQLVKETSCVNQSECPEGLVCRFQQCTNSCETDRDCPGGVRCELSPAGNACIDRSVQPCTRDTECDVTGVSGPRERCVARRCRQECFSDRDCRNDFWCNVAEAGTCWPPPRPPRPDGGGMDGGAIDGGGMSPFPTVPAWREVRAGAYTYVAALAGGQLVFSSMDVMFTAPGGLLHVLDPSARIWRTVPFPQSRLNMSSAVRGGSLYLTGGSYSTSGGDPFTDVVRFDPATDALTTIGIAVSQPRVASTAVFCGNLLILAGGDPINTTGSGSASVDFIDVVTPSSSTVDLLPMPTRGMGAVIDGTRAVFAGGTHDLMFGNDYATNVVRTLDCTTRTWSTSTMPNYYAGMQGVVSGRRAYFVGSRLPNGTDVIRSPDITSNAIEVLDLDTSTWSTTLPPAATDTSVVNIEASADFLFRSAGRTVQALQLSTGVWTSFSVDFDVARLFTDGATLYLVGQAPPAMDLIVQAYTIP